MKRTFLPLAVFLTASVMVVGQNVGIGNNSPLMKLHVSKNDSAVALLENTQPLLTNTSAALYFKIGNGSLPYTGAIKTIGTGADAARMGFFTYTAQTANGLRERMSIADAGNVGIGTTTPQTALHINPNGAGSLLIGTNRSSGGYTNLEMGINAQSNGYGYIQAIKKAGTSYGDLVFNPNGGRVGVGTSTPTSTLDVHGGISLPIKVITSDYTVQNADYTIVVDMQNDTNKIVNIYLPPQFVNPGRIVRIVPINMEISHGFNSYLPNTTINLVKIFDASGTVLYETLFNRFYQHNYIDNPYGVNLRHNEFRMEKKTAVTLQCIAATGWVITDLDAEKDTWEYVN